MVDYNSIVYLILGLAEYHEFEKSIPASRSGSQERKREDEDTDGHVVMKDYSTYMENMKAQLDPTVRRSSWSESSTDNGLNNLEVSMAGTGKGEGKIRPGSHTDYQSSITFSNKGTELSGVSKSNCFKDYYFIKRYEDCSKAAYEDASSARWGRGNGPWR